MLALASLVLVLAFAVTGVPSPLVPIVPPRINPRPAWSKLLPLKSSMRIAADICIYTNRNIVVEEL